MLAKIASLLRPRASMTESDVILCQNGPVPSCAVPAAESSLITSTTRREKRKPDACNPPPSLKRQKPCLSGDHTDVCDKDDQENQPSSMLGASSAADHPSKHDRGALGVLLTPIYWLHQGEQRTAADQPDEQDSLIAVAQEAGQVQSEASASADVPADCASPTSSSTPTVSQPSIAGQHSLHTHSVSHQQFLQQQEELYHQQQVTSGAAEDSEDADYDEEDFDPFVFIAQLGPVEHYADPGRQPLLPRQTRTCKQKTLVLDLDETLVHSTLDAACGVGADFTFPVMFNGAEHMVHVRQRPYMRKFLEAVARDWEVVVFTASQKVYAEKLLNILDPHRQLIRHRIYRDSCVLVDGNYLKDLTVLGRELSRCAIVDNSPQAFGFQVENGIPIESWYDDPEDSELMQLLPFLSELASNDVPDVRPRIRKKFNLENKIRQAYQVAYTMHMHQTAAVALLQPQQLVVQLQQMPQAQVQQA